MEGEHGFNTREEWQNYFQIYFDQIRELEEINSFQMNKEPQQWLADFSTKAQKLENTREEWQNYFQIYFDQIRELEEINSFQMNKEPQQWLADFSTKAQKLEKKYQEQNVYLQQHVYYFTREGHPWTRNIADPLLSFLYRYSTRFEDIAAAYELAPFCTGTVHVLKILPPLMNWLAVYMHFMKHKTTLWH